MGDLWNMRSVHPKLGFQKSYFREDFVQRDVIGLGVSDAEFFRQMVPRLEKQREPFMTVVHRLEITRRADPAWRAGAGAGEGPCPGRSGGRGE